MNRRDNHSIRTPREVQEAPEPNSPVVLPSLIEHLREMFPPIVLVETEEVNGVDAAVQLALDIRASKAHQAVIAYLNSLVKRPDEEADA